MCAFLVFDLFVAALLVAASGESWISGSSDSPGDSR